MTKKSSKATVAAIAAIILIALAFSSVYVFYPQVFNSFLNSQSNSITSMSQITVDPQGGSESANGALTGVYWNGVINVDAADVVQGFLLPNGTVAPTTVAGIQKEVTNTASVEIDITPLQPYLIRDLQVQSVTAAPAGTGSSGSSNALMFQYFAWAEPSFRIYTPYLVTIKQNGNVIYTGPLDTQNKADVTQQISTNQGTILIENLGGLQGPYLTPNTPSQVCILSQSPMSFGYMYDWAQIQSMVTGTTTPNTETTNSQSNVAGTGSPNAAKYSDYWYGIQTNSAGQAINLQLGNILSGPSWEYQPQYWGGWEGTGGKSGVFNEPNKVTAVKPVIYSNDKSSLPSDKQMFLSLTEWLQNKGIANLDSSSTGQSPFSQYGGASSARLVGDNGGMALEINVPWSAYMTPEVQVRIPAQMANTFVERPQISDIS